MARRQESAVFKTIFCGHDINKGLVESLAQELLTVILKVQTDELPLASLAVKITSVTPAVKQSPDSREPIISVIPQLSVANGSFQSTNTQLSVVVLVIFCGQKWKRGLVVSLVQGLLTVTQKEHVALLPLASVAV